MISVDEAGARIRRNLARVPFEEVTLSQSAGRVLAVDVVSAVTKPPAAVSSMDGYAVRAVDVSTVPTTLDIVGEAPAGHALTGTIGPGEAVRIFTGGVLPVGADSVVIQENTVRDGSRVIVQESVHEGRFVRQRGLDFAQGDAAGLAGRLLGPREIGLIASMNASWVQVARRPRIAIMGTGDELVRPGDVPRSDQVVSSNSLVLGALVTQAGGEAVSLGIARDNRQSILDCLRHAAGSDMLVVTGGMSVGEHDLVRKVMEDQGMDLDFWKVAMRPGKPLAFGLLGSMPVLGFPGNPVSTLVCGHLFLRPAIHTMLGRVDGDIGKEPAITTTDLAANDERQDYLRATHTRNASGQIDVTAFDRQDSSMVAVLASASCFIIRAPHAPAVPAGGQVTILRLDT
ncbi:MAG: molybdopterin molybdotransferase MoeA [bacterium]|nr:molybdopterin molybdotransferase MoeA [bacterium]MDE0240154.1 molybdopterin molybdotransferase MoeA [bacterium]